ncbi:SixA phosphatase family protein [Reinekea marinisedimentorum]|uniref:Phosphohistidine phosphatase n=1 Tax=Reinekea marinisedimentorum TaxID=230495 RepID=A0A4R3I4D0_9GAMM|nr:histidine phosphatase family protein [Reinekea marinisedimentorum]TCS39933.1 phosphohistidine phosphatase [Reinekea marinisedimentorum]
MYLYLMRHGEAEVIARDDASRPLTATGRASVASKSRFIDSVELMVVSPYLRALQSADILVEEGLSVQRRLIDDRVTPDCPLDPVVSDVIQPGLSAQLIVAHNPLLTRLVRSLCGDEAANVALGTADLVCLSGDFLPGCARLEWVR